MEEKNKDLKKEVKKEEPKFKKVDKKEIKKDNKKKENKKETKVAKWVPTVITVVVVLLVAALLTVMIVTSSAPKKSLDALLTNLKAGDFEKAQEYLSGEDLIVSTGDVDQETQKLLFDKLNWKIGNVTENEDNTATIEVEITTKDFQTIINNYMQKALEAVKGAIIGNNSDQSFSSTDFENYFIEELQNEDIQTTTINTTINAVKEDKEWKIVSDESLVNALLPGLQETVDSLS